ncbi:hypothetical protein WIW89_12955 [Stygiolobus sp. CP850M]|jgi:hypothetical protein|uniref:hypothetical protein n=1 Tax=Stygiolobus sp. CP850M TaxID=3133134 RepID=UPI0028CC6528|nr:hypothetical protein [Sulfolobaceae archaeon]
MILATLGSNKLVTTLDAIMTEIFTGIRPDKILILSEEARDLDLTGVMKSFGINAETKVLELGVGINNWRDKVKDISIDVADITPGRKYMAIAVLNYSQAREVRYAYLKEESKGYHIFGYVPLQEITVFDVRKGTSVSYDPPKTVPNLPEKVDIKVESLKALVNLYSLLGKVDYDEDFEELCKLRSGDIRFKEEEEIREYVKKGYFFLADVNAYVHLGERLAKITWDRENGPRLLPSRSTYNELLRLTKSTQKGEDPKFYLAMSSYRRIHKQVPVSESSRGSDVALINEAKALKKELPAPLAVISGDQGVRRSGMSQGVEVILLHDKVKGQRDVGELLFCESFYKKIEISVNGEPFARILNSNFPDKRKVTVETLKAEYNYAYVLSKLEEIMKNNSNEN